MFLNSFIKSPPPANLGDKISFVDIAATVFSAKQKKKKRKLIFFTMTTKKVSHTFLLFFWARLKMVCSEPKGRLPPA